MGPRRARSAAGRAAARAGQAAAGPSALRRDKSPRLPPPPPRVPGSRQHAGPVHARTVHAAPGVCGRAAVRRPLQRCCAADGSPCPRAARDRPPAQGRLRAALSPPWVTDKLWLPPGYVSVTFSHNRRHSSGSPALTRGGVRRGEVCFSRNVLNFRFTTAPSHVFPDARPRSAVVGCVLYSSVFAPQRERRSRTQRH